MLYGVQKMFIKVTNRSIYILFHFYKIIAYLFELINFVNFYNISNIICNL